MQQLLRPYIEKEIKKNPNVTLSGLFKRLRMKVPLVGDYIVLRFISRNMGELGRNLSQGAIKNACLYSQEYIKSGMSRSEGKPMWIKTIHQSNKLAFKESGLKDIATSKRGNNFKKYKNI